MKISCKFALVLAGLLGFSVQPVRAASADGNRLIVPPAFPVYDSDHPSAWSASNGVSVVWASGGSGASTSQVAAGVTNLVWPNNTNCSACSPKVLLAESVIGSPFEHIRPEYYLGDRIEPLSNVNWAATYDRLTNSEAFLNDFIFYQGVGTNALFVSGGGAFDIAWVLNDGTISTNHYVVSATSRGRPYRIFWTDSPYEAPQVDLSGKFVRFYGNRDISEAHWRTTTNANGIVLSNVVSGLFLDPTTHGLQAVGGIRGQVVMAYYETGSFGKMLTNIVLEVGEPVKETVGGEIGRELVATGDGYDPSGLSAMISEGIDDPGDDRGPYVYQHRGNFSYSPNNGKIYALRRTVGEPWKIEIYWREKDAMGTDWPFEVLNYQCDWPADAVAYVRGNSAGTNGPDLGLSVHIPSSYSTELQKFQEPDGHAKLDGNFYTTRDGYALLKLTGAGAAGDDNVWFLPIHSIYRDDSSFDLNPISWPVGVEVGPQPTTISLRFDGSSASAAVNLSNQLDRSFTVEGYFRWEKNGQDQVIFYKQGAAPGFPDFYVSITTDGIVRAALQPTNDRPDLVALRPLSAPGEGAPAWTFIALSYDQVSSNATLYVGSEVISHGGIARGPGGGWLSFGCSADGKPSFRGNMDELRVWGKALSTQEVAQGRSGGALREADTLNDLVAYYPVEDAVGRIVSDASGHGHDATMVNCIRASTGVFGTTPEVVSQYSRYHGYIYEADSGRNYNTNLYLRPDAASTNQAAAVGVTTTNESYLFAINKTGTQRPIEVWWSGEVNQPDMPEPLWFPGVVQRYTFDWLTNDLSYPAIVLASQEGSANSNLVKKGAALDFTRSVSSRMTIAEERGWFAGSNYTVECWIKPASSNMAGCVFDFGNSISNNRVTLTLLSSGSLQFELFGATGGQASATSTSKLVRPVGWNHLALVVSNGLAMIYLNSHPAGGPLSVEAGLWDHTNTTVNLLGVSMDTNAAYGFDGQVDDFTIWGVARSGVEVYQDMLNPRSGTEPGLRLYYPFDEEYRMDGATDARSAYDRVGNVHGLITLSSWVLPGCPRLDDGLLMSDETPIVYYQNDATQAGYNPNEEHAFVRAGGGGYVTYALRCDLNETNSSDPFVLVQYRDPANQNRPNMAVYEVVATNLLYPDFAGRMIAGTMVPGPHPLDFLPDPWTSNTFWGSLANKNSTNEAGYRDRKQQIWAKRAGTDSPTGTATLVMNNFYPMQDGFFFPDLATQPALHTPVPWLCRLTNRVAEVRTGAPTPWTWTVAWPANAPSLDVGQTLTKAVDGLPEVWTAENLRNVYAPAGSTELYDPVVAQTAGLEFEGEFADYFGFKTGPNATIILKNGKTYFRNVPPSISDRFYFDPAAPKRACLKLEGRLVEHAGGLRYLQLNVLSEEEREALEGLAKNEDHAHEWIQAIRELAEERVPARETNGVVNYALTHMGPGAPGYVTLVENDTTNEVFGVNAGDPVTLHIIHLSTNLYAGSVLPIEDPNNLLSEQLDLLYTESFAGDASQYEFEWKRAEPNADGTTSTDYEYGYDLYREEPGLTRFTVGKEGDTLENMVNNFYVLRYRALSNAPAHEVTGDRWSAWIGPTLAEGWVERVLNNVTPFTQRMQDLYNNPTETTVSMIQQAGRPYEGDVALNQDNLNSVGLIQLYQTILNTAESMSIRLGINNADANQQLMLAATRLNDLYMLLGNEAYADAMDPTIGFGSDFYNSSSLALNGVDYGAMSSSLFCFDNLEPNLRSEELALLRGRSDQLAPSLRLSPIYNRLYWNFTKGITAGEVAYAMNYQIQGDEVIIDQPQAAALYPQGHGDAWGHYLSALYGYYRLLRNPHFSWGAPSITPLMVGDAVVDADYYDEEKFAESAAALARTAVEVVKRTAEQAYVENGGKELAGYRDTDGNRAFGYGEWGARAGLSALYNWAVANSLLPPQVDPAAYAFLTFATNTQLYCGAPSTKVNFRSNFTVEFSFESSLALPSNSACSYLVDWTGTNLDRDAEGAWNFHLEPATTSLVFSLQTSGAITNTLRVAAPPPGVKKHVAVTYATSNRILSLYLEGVLQATNGPVSVAASIPATQAVLRLAASDSPAPWAGSLSEFRIWKVTRTPAQLLGARDGVNASSDGLVMYQRFISESGDAVYVQDESSGASWLADNPMWTNQASAGVSLGYADNSILRINRDSVGSLSEIAAAMRDVQRTVDMADAGMTPIGLSDSAIPFDIDPSELANGKSHFEQIAERAELALGNAATLLDRAQGISKLQRQQTQNAINMQQDLANEELALDTQLIGIFGYPYADDIGAGKTYPQGYDGPDLFHFMWMDLGSYGIQEFDTKPVKNLTFTYAGFFAYNNETFNLSMDIAANGMIVKPDEIQGTRRAQGRLQAAYGTFIQSYFEYRKALDTYDAAVDFFAAQMAVADAKVVANAVLQGLAWGGSHSAATQMEREITEQKSLLKASIEQDYYYDSTKFEALSEQLTIPFDLIVGMSESTMPGLMKKKEVHSWYQAKVRTELGAARQAKTEYETSKITKEKESKWREILKEISEWVFESAELALESSKAVLEANDAAMALDVAHAAMVNAQESYLSVLAEGEQILSKRETLRKQAANRIAAGRYQDMAFRTFRTDALANYGNAFDLAKKYTYLAAKAYDYETALGLTNSFGPDALFCQIVGERTLGFMDEGKAQLGGLHGDGGLADVLARLKANWLVLKGRLGINNPQIEQNWLSLRWEGFRISSSNADDWKNKLTLCKVDDLLAYPEFQRYCQSFQSSSGLLPQEPGLVIPFSTSIDFAKNVFGWDLGGGDHAFDSSYYATKIRKTGVKLVGYPTGTNGLSSTPRVYLIPVGHDVMRSPGSYGGDLLAYHVVDQVVPLPFPLGGSSLDEPDWTSVYTAYTGSGDPLATLRRYPSLRAYEAGTADEAAMLSNTRLVGRSVWNTRWLLIIPAGALQGDRDLALKTFIDNVTDIQIGFETYSNSGN